MPSTAIRIKNATSKTMHFHIEPECLPFELDAGGVVDISGEYESEPVSIQFSDDTEFGMFGSVFPGDGRLTVRVNGEIIFQDE